jgi:glycopeptide antibiotics resistance protein
MMLKYIIKDLKETLAYLPYGIMAGAAMGLILNSMNARRERKGKDAFPMMGIMVFSLYLMIILVITFFSREDGSWTGMDLELFSTWGTNARNHAFVVENVLLFIPYGFICPWAFPWLRGFFRNTFVAFVTSFGVETIQLITGRGYFQVDDILTNVLGAVIGYLLFQILYGMLRRFRRPDLRR